MNKMSVPTMMGFHKFRYRNESEAGRSECSILYKSFSLSLVIVMLSISFPRLHKERQRCIYLNYCAVASPELLLWVGKKKNTYKFFKR